MPELPEVEIIRRAILPYVIGKKIEHVSVRSLKLRWEVSSEIGNLGGATIEQVERRGKYLLFGLPAGTMIIHLGMSGHLSLVPQSSPYGKHDHLDFILEGDKVLRFSDPRKFGAVIFTEDDPLRHELLSGLGPEPLSPDFNGGYLYRETRSSARAIKLFIMDGKKVAGVGNIYASESLFRAGIAPARPALSLNENECARLAAGITETLTDAIQQGEKWLQTVDQKTLPAYFHVDTAIYGHDGAPCLQCGTPIEKYILGQRSTYSCPRCQS